MSPAAAKRHVVAVAITDDLPVFELAVPCEVFGVDRADLVDPWYELRLCAAEPGPLRVRSGLLVQTGYTLDDLVAADTVLLPACNRTVQCGPPPALVEAVLAAHARGARIASICSGAYVLAEAGLLDGRRATTHWMNALDFAHRYPRVKVDPEVLYVDEGDVLTSAGTGSAIDLCLHLVRQDFGAAVANEVARRMVVPPHREGGQAQFAQPLARGEARSEIAPVLGWARDRLDQPLTVAQLARQAHLSPRTFARRFRDSLGVSPLQWLLEQRIRRAQELLETTDDPVERIAARVGFGTAVNMRTHFRRFTSVPPQTYRQVFRRGVAATR
ncbi:GlxA family transcriptional regulator [Catellatospora tritici]|uniref:GlxA family transcriptional regulator n=1 Tax=Catellatospora tritici TaxID=2851566 RepID=UPI001C2DC0CC|nr:helix-turn-helix domain-containing protein [Catellatospora tritici]MBV1855450.1 helix-turn-helix domain-containing protein [Catellatospora tritici]